MKLIGLADLVIQSLIAAVAVQKAACLAHQVNLVHRACQANPAPVYPALAHLRFHLNPLKGVAHRLRTDLLPYV